MKLLFCLSCGDFHELHNPVAGKNYDGWICPACRRENQIVDLLQWIHRDLELPADSEAFVEDCLEYLHSQNGADEAERLHELLGE